MRRADEVLTAQPEEAWQTITWRRGTDGPLTKQFIALRVHRAVGETTGREGWLITPSKAPLGSAAWTAVTRSPVGVDVSAEGRWSLARSASVPVKGLRFTFGTVGEDTIGYLAAIWSGANTATS